MWNAYYICNAGVISLPGTYDKINVCKNELHVRGVQCKSVVRMLLELQPFRKTVGIKSSNYKKETNTF
jgi:hypothetical protein